MKNHNNPRSRSRRRRVMSASSLMATTTTLLLAQSRSQVGQVLGLMHSSKTNMPGVTPLPLKDATTLRPWSIRGASSSSFESHLVSNAKSKARESSFSSSGTSSPSERRGSKSSSKGKAYRKGKNIQNPQARFEKKLEEMRQKEKSGEELSRKLVLSPRGDRVLLLWSLLKEIF